MCGTCTGMRRFGECPFLAKGLSSKTVELAELIVISTSVEASSAAAGEDPENIGTTVAIMRIIDLIP